MIEINWHFGAVAMCILLASCGGSGGDSASSSESKTPVVRLQVSSNSMQVGSHEGDAFPILIEGTWSAADLEGHSVYIRAQDSFNNIISTVTIDASSSKSFRIEMPLDRTLAQGVYDSKISLLACLDKDCTRKYSDATADVAVALSIGKVPEWQTHQGNSSHDGYVPIWVNGTSFKKLWEWKRAPSSEPIGGINAPVAGNGDVYVSTDVYFGDAAVIALDELTGSEKWRVSFGNVPALNPPAVNESTLFVATSGHENTKVWGINRADGRIVFQTPFESQWGHYLAPTPDKNAIYQTGGYYGGYTYDFLNDTGERKWTATTGSSWSMDTPAVDDESVYVHNGQSLFVLGKTDGVQKYVISDPFGSSSGGYDYHGSPVKGGQNDVLAFAGLAFSGRASSNTESYENRIISSFDVKNGLYKWSTRFSYKTFFALSNGVVYAGRNNPVALDAIDETSGELLWSWVPQSTQDTEFHRNIVVTKNLLFVSTNANLYAIDLKSKQSVWSYNEPGMIAISNRRILLLAPGSQASDGRLLAFDLR